MATAFKLSNGSLLVSTEAPGGVYNASQLMAIATISEQHGAIVKATEDHRLSIVVPAGKEEEVGAALAEAGLGMRHYQDGLHQPVSCIGAMCSEHQLDAMSAALDLTESLYGVTASAPLKIGFNGCARACVPTHTLDIAVLADMGGYRISLGGKNSQIPEMATFMAEGVPEDKVVELVRKVVDVFNGLQEGEETLQEVMERAGNQPFIEALTPYSQDAHAGDDPFAGFGPDEGGAATDAEEDTVTEELDLDDLPDESDLEAGAVTVAVEDDLELEDEILSDDSLEDLDLDEAGIEDSIDDIADDEEISLEAEEIAEEADVSDVVDEEDREPGFEADEEDISEVSEAEADAFEEKLNASIEDEESVPESQDDNQHERLQAVELVEAESDFEDIHDDFGDEIASIEDDFEEDFSEESIVDATPPEPTPVRPVAADGEEWVFAGLDPMRDGRLLIRFEGGAEVMIDPSAIDGTRALQFGAACVRVVVNHQGCQVEVGGVGLFLPRAVA